MSSKGLKFKSRRLKLIECLSDKSLKVMGRFGHVYFDRNTGTHRIRINTKQENYVNYHSNNR